MSQEERLIRKSGQQTSDPRAHVTNIGRILDEVIELIEGDILLMDEPQALALFETSKEVLEGVRTAFLHYEQGNEKAWKK